MAVERDPYQVLGLSRGASLEDVKRAYRGLAKANHPDAAGPAALPRFLAIQAAYESIAGGGSTGPGGSRSASRPSSADPDRAGATHRAYGARGRRPRPGSTPGGFGGWAAGGAAPSGAAGGTDAGGSAADGTGRSGGGASARSAGSSAGRTAGGGPAAGGPTPPGGAGASAGATASGGAAASGAASSGGAATSGGPATSAPALQARPPPAARTLRARPAQPWPAGRRRLRRPEGRLDCRVHNRLRPLHRAGPDGGR